VSLGFFLLASLAWNIGLGMTFLVLPLYAVSQGLSNAEVGALIALPVIVQVPFNLAGGAYTDRIGGRRIMLGSCLAMGAAGVWLIFAHGFWLLIACQVVLVLSRAAFWPATWAMASELPGERGVQLGRLNAVTNLGQIGGTALCGFMLAGTGFTATFSVLAAVGFAAFVAGLGTRALPRKAAAPDRHVMAGYAPLLRRPVIHYLVLCAFLSALPTSLSFSFYPLLLAHYGFSEDASGLLLALRAFGAIAVGLVAGRLVRTGPQTLWPVGCGLAVALAVGFLPVINNVAFIGFWLLLVGIGSGAMTLYFQITISEQSKPEERGSALALGGMGWSISHLTMPLLMGFIADRYGIVAAFYAVGALGLAGAAAVAWARRWAFRPASSLTPP
jgi:MFS family permease